MSKNLNNLDTTIKTQEDNKIWSVGNNTEMTYIASVSNENVKIIAQLFNMLEKAQNCMPKTKNAKYEISDNYRLRGKISK